MSRIRANKITDKAGTGAIEIEKGAWFPVGYGLTGAGSVNITGVVTATSFVGSGAALTGIDATAIKDSGGNVKVQAQASGAVYTGVHTFTTLNSSTGTFSGDLDVDGHTNLDNVNVAGVATFASAVNTGALTASTGTFSGSVSVGGTLTYEDVTNIDSVGIITAREGIFVPDSKTIHIGNSSGNGDLRLYHDGSNSFIQDAGTGNLKVIASVFQLRNAADNETMIEAHDNGQVELYHNNTERLVTTNSGVTVTGTVAATAYTGDGSALTGIDVGLSTEALTTAGGTVTLDLTKDDHKITKSGTYTVTCTGGTEGSSHSLRIENSGTSSVSFSSYFKFPSGGTPSLPTTNGAISLISFTVHKAGSVGVNTVLLAGASVNFS